MATIEHDAIYLECLSFIQQEVKKISSEHPDDAIYLECLSFIQQEVKKISSELEFFFIKKLRDLVKRVKVPESFLEKGTEAGIVDCINSYVVRYHTLHFLEQMIGILLDREKRDNTHSPLFKKIKDDIKEDIKQVWRDETGEEF